MGPNSTVEFLFNRSDPRRGLDGVAAVTLTRGTIMGRWTLRAAAVSAVALVCLGGEARAQYGYPVGYGGYGWGGWGGGGGQTVQGNVARGLGAYAAGAGAYNEQTAVARSINADTVTKFNEYMWESQVL